MKSRRTIVAAFIVALWVIGMAMMVRRNANRSDDQKLVEVALRLQPATFYYVVSRDGAQIGAASSALDTTAKTLVSEEYFVGDYSSRRGVERTSARWQTRLTRGFRLADLTIDVARPTLPFSLSAAVQQDSTLFVTGTGEGIARSGTRQSFAAPIFTPSLAPVLFMLSGNPKIGRTQKIPVFDPLTRAVLEPELAIRAESLFTVVDSAIKDHAGNWTVAHRDTVRAWRIDGAPYGVSAWVDAEGRIVRATAGSFAVTRTAFEIAFKNSRAR